MMAKRCVDYLEIVRLKFWEKKDGAGLSELKTALTLLLRGR